ncbi:putative stress response RCI peptide [Geranomyces variabilis]|nr:putative stress response RCI peptide [Geranomyces variabilis]
MSLAQFCDYLLAFLLPPLGVFFKRGCSVDLLINIGLTLLGYIPGIAHAFWIIHTHRPSVMLS